MKLAISQMLLEDAKFAHRADFLSAAPGPIAPSTVDLRVELAKGEDPTGALVRVRASSVAESPYDFSVSYLALLKIDLEGAAPPEDADKRLMMTGAIMVFPFVREIVANLTMRGRFGPSWIAPTDFASIIGVDSSPPPATANTL